MDTRLKKGKAHLEDDSPRRLSLEERERMRKILGVDPGGDILLHVGKRANEAAKALGAEAFTLGGDDIFFRDGAYRSGTPAGDRLLAHELTHVLESTPGFKEGPPPSDSEREKAEQRAERAEQAVQQVAQNETAKQLSAADKELLVAKVVSLIESQQRRDRERRGR